MNKLFDISKLNRFLLAVWIPLVILMIIGGLNVFATTYFDAYQPSRLFYNQLLFYILSITILLVLSITNPKILLSKYTFIIANIVTVILLIAVLFIGIDVFGTRRWIDLGFFNLQPAELAKLTLVYNIAFVLSDASESLFKNVKSTVLSNTFLKYVLIILLTTTLIFLVFLERSLGNTILMVGIVFLTLFLSISFSAKQYFYAVIVVVFTYISIQFQLFQSTVLGYVLIYSIILVTGIIITFIINRFVNANKIVLLLLILLSSLSFQALLFGYSSILEDYQRERIDSYLISSEADELNRDWNRIQSITACGSGRLFGKGYLQGTHSRNSFLPFPETDFAFCAWTEQFGFLGGVLLMFVLVILMLQIKKAGDVTNDRFSEVFINGVVAIILLNTIQHIGMNIGLLPITGVPLPLVSYGGSSIISLSIGVGIVLSMYNFKAPAIKVIQKT